jgi:hypothetical protein
MVKISFHEVITLLFFINLMRIYMRFYLWVRKCYYKQQSSSRDYTHTPFFAAQNIRQVFRIIFTILDNDVTLLIIPLFAFSSYTFRAYLFSFLYSTFSFRVCLMRTSYALKI